MKTTAGAGWLAKPVVKSRSLQTIWRYRYLYLLGLPGIVYFIFFKYVPMYGILIAFQDYTPIKGVLESDWVGLEHFRRLFDDPDFSIIFRNTLIISLLHVLVQFPAPILLALLLNEVRWQAYKRSIQTMIYFPHFLSWVIVVSITYLMTSSEYGLINKAIEALGGERISFLLENKYFYGIVTVQGIWKDIGWGTIIYLAAIAGVNPSLYEAARLDGAGHFAQIRHVTIPSIMPTIIILFILGLGSAMEVNFEQLWLMQNPLVMKVAEVFDTYVYKTGIRSGEYSYSTAAGLFKSVIGVVLVVAANRIANKKGHEGIW
ncbi:ABC transporter permease subunit [Paenibacillus sp. N4]|uniref:ABC transporter permease n=1 Tax=Paenibacillus vietnamensis TaxID=2590547 RepID=UPI001CD06B26|nr:ABC transporter permease subunit [Paenibacillus vietnamensis]MCA0755903.1 ABC transporter permease subunit [Paenibacillus vietnamensis]